MIQVRRLSKEYAGGVLGLEDVNLDIAAGEFVVLMGPRGAGKSTLLRCLNGLAAPTVGEIIVGREAATGASGDRLRRIRARGGFIFQQFNLLHRLTVLENVLIGRLAHISQWRSLLAWFPPPMWSGPAWLSSGWTSSGPGTAGSTRCQEASSSALPSPALWCRSHASSWPTSRWRALTPRCHTR